MSGISSISPKTTGSQLQAARTPPPPSAEVREQHTARFEQRIDKALQSAGVDQNTADAIKSDLKSALASVESTGTFPPDRDALKQTVDDVFAKHGLDASKILERRGPSSQANGPPPSSQDNDLATVIQTLLENLDSGDSSELSQSVVTALLGYDVQA